MFVVWKCIFVKEGKTSGKLKHKLTSSQKLQELNNVEWIKILA